MKVKPSQTKLIQENRTIIQEAIDEVLHLVVNLVISEAVRRGLSRSSPLKNCSYGGADTFTRIVLQDAHGIKMTLDLHNSEVPIVGMPGNWRLQSMIKKEWYPEEEEELDSTQTVEYLD